MHIQKIPFRRKKVKRLTDYITLTANKRGDGLSVKLFHPKCRVI